MPTSLSSSHVDVRKRRRNSCLTIKHKLDQICILSNLTNWAEWRLLCTYLFAFVIVSKIKSIFLHFRIHHKKKHSLNQLCPRLAKNAPPICHRDPSSLQKVSMTFPARTSSFTQFLTASVSFVPSCCESVFIVRCYVMCHESLNFPVESIKELSQLHCKNKRSGRLWFNSFVGILTFKLYQLNESIKTVFDGKKMKCFMISIHVSDEQRQRHSNNVLIVRMSELCSVFLDFHRASLHTMCVVWTNLIMPRALNKSLNASARWWWCCCWLKCIIITFLRFKTHAGCWSVDWLMRRALRDSMTFRFSPDSARFRFL